MLQEQFADRRGVGVQMVQRAVGPLADPEEIARSCEVLVADLLHSLQR